MRMEPVLQHAVRKFIAGEHLRTVLDGPWIELVDETGAPLPGIRGRTGATAHTAEEIEIGADVIEMQPGSAFPLHTHPGQHILYVIDGEGFVHIDGEDHAVKAGDTIFIPAEYAHGVRTMALAAGPLLLLSVGYPHQHIGSRERMRTVDESAGSR
jgi:quercetin dioxygenase-like cupin family protein